MAAVEQQSKYEIAGSEYRCQACGGEVPCETGYFSAVVLREERFQRLDYCIACWGDGSEARKGDVYAFWKTRRPPLPSAKPRRMRFDTGVVFDFFRKLDGAGAEKAGETPPQAAEASAGGESVAAAARPLADHDDLRFVLALLLVRKKILDLGSTVERDGAEWLQLAVRKEPREKFWVKNPGLNGRKLDLVKQSIGELLQMSV